LLALFDAKFHSVHQILLRRHFEFQVHVYFFSRKSFGQGSALGVAVCGIVFLCRGFGLIMGVLVLVVWVVCIVGLSMVGAGVALVLSVALADFLAWASHFFLAIASLEC
jgi:hypothetical protein